MKEYPVNSTAKPYFDIDGNPTTLYRLVRSEPDWAESRIKEGEKAIAKCDQLAAQNRRLLTAVMWAVKAITG